MLFGSSGKQKKTSTEGDKVKGVNKAKARIQECVTARVRIIRAAFEPGDFKYEASQECISIATVMTLRTISSVAVLLCLQGSMHIATLALWMVLAASSGWCFATIPWLSPTAFPKCLVCVEGVSSLSTTSCTVSRSATKVSCPQAMDWQIPGRSIETKGQTMLKPMVVLVCSSYRCCSRSGTFRCGRWWRAIVRFHLCQFSF